MTLNNTNFFQEVSAKHASKVFEDESREKSKYIMVQGPVKALGSTIPSMYMPNTSGVVQKLSTSELLMKRNSSGFWFVCLDLYQQFSQCKTLYPTVHKVNEHCPFSFDLDNQSFNSTAVLIADWDLSYNLMFINFTLWVKMNIGPRRKEGSIKIPLHKQNEPTQDKTKTFKLFIRTICQYSISPA